MATNACETCGGDKGLNMRYCKMSCRPKSKDPVVIKRKEYAKAYSRRNAHKRSEYREKYFLKNPDKAILYTVKRYGLTPDQYRALGNNCSICGVEQGESDRRLSVDHCHETGVVRGLLCRMCNLGIGNLRTSTNLRLAADYLDKYK